MKLRTVLTATAGAVTGAVVGNQLLEKRAGELRKPLPGVERIYRWRGMDVAYTAAGDPTNPDLLCVHGIHAAASSNEFAAIFDELAEEYHVIAVDLPGFGRSDRPPLVYSADLYAEFLGEFTAEVLEDPVVVTSSLSGSFAAAGIDDEAIDRLVLVCPTDETTQSRPWVRTLLRTPVVGTTLFNLIASKPSIRKFLARDGYYDADNIDEGEIEYAWQTAHQPGARFAPASFASGTLDPDIDLATELQGLQVPVTLVWGRDAKVVPLREGRTLAEAADVDLVVVDYADLLPHAEHPEAFLKALESPRQRES
ncbi:alpha/beta fold hydrolase [Natrialbaceae archaeon A-gly3]